MSVDDAKDYRPDQESVEQLANRVMEDVRSGKQPSSSELEEQFPELQGDVDGLVKTLSILEEASHRRRRERPNNAVIDAAGNRQQVLGGYRLIREINRGGMGIVYEAEQESLHRQVALKVLPPSPLLTDVERSRFQREGQAIARLHHSNIVPVFGTGEQGGIQYCVMQLIHGFSLQELIGYLRRCVGCDDPEMPISATDRAPSDRSKHDCSPPCTKVFGLSIETAASLLVGGKLPTTTAEIPVSYWRNIARLGADVADALGHAHHQGVLHRDIKPGNLLLDRDAHIWLTDFGLAKLHGDDNLTAKGNLIGTLKYTPPELFDGHSDQRSDIYSLGLTLYELCVLQPPFAGSDRRELMRKVMDETPPRPRSVNSRIPRDLETIILKATRPDPSSRYVSADDFAQDLRNFLGDRTLLARRQSAPARALRWCRRHRSETALGSLLVTMLLLFAITSSVAYVREARRRIKADDDVTRIRATLDHVYDSFLPDWSTSSTVSAHGSISVTPESAQLLEQLVAFYDDLVQRGRNESEPAAILEHTAAMRRIGLIYHRLGEFEKAIGAYSKAKSRLAIFYVKQPNPLLQLEHARVLNELGAVHYTEHHDQKASRCHQDALKLLQAIADNVKGQMELDLRFEFARTLFLLERRARGFGGGVLSRPDPTRLAQAESGGESVRSKGISFSIEILEELTNQHPDRLEYLHLLALCYREQSDGLLDDQGEPADDSIKTSIEILESLTALLPDHPGYQYALCQTLQWIRMPEGPTEEAVEAAAQRFRRSIAIAEQVSAQRPSEWIYAASLVEGNLQLTSFLKKGNRLEEALASSQRAVETTIALDAKYPDCNTFQYWVGFTQLRHGNLLRVMKRHPEAIAAYERSLPNLMLSLTKRSDYEWQRVVLRNLERASIGKASSLSALNRDDESKVFRRIAEEYRQQLAQLSR